MGKPQWVTVSSSQAFRFTKPGQSLTGVYSGSRKIDTKFGEGRIHNITDDKGKEHGIFESANLQVLRECRKGEPVRITFEGKVKIKGGKKVNRFVVQVAPTSKLAKG